MSDGEVECPHFGRLITPGECTICSGKDRPDDAPGVRTFKARWPGHCHSCNLPIYVDELIAWREGQPVIHAACLPEGEWP